MIFGFWYGKIIIILVLVLVLVGQASAWQTGWNYRTNFTFNNTGNNLTNYQVNISVDTYNLIRDGKLNANGSDLQFFKSDDVNLIYWWNQTDFNKTNTIIWLNLSSVVNTSNTTVFMYYGNKSATTSVYLDGNKTFILFDDFKGTNGIAPDSNKWIVYKNGTTTGSSALLDGNGNVSLKPTLTAVSSTSLRSVMNFSNDFSVDLRQYLQKSGTLTGGVYTDFSAGNSSAAQGYTGTTNNWHHTMLAQGVAWIAQDPINAASVKDIEIAIPPSGSLGSLSSVDLSPTPNFMLVNNFSIMRYGYNSTGFISFDRMDNETYRKKLTLSTYDGSGETVHPSVYFDPRIGGFQGYKYWMLITPYAGNNASLENPSIFQSDDGFEWKVPVGLTNPIEPAPPGNPTNHNNDPELIFNPTTQQLMAYWGYDNTTENTLYLKLSSNGTTWSPKIQAAATGGADWTMSPSIQRIDNDTYKMFAVNKTPNPNTVDIYNGTTGGINFVKWTNATFDWVPTGQEWWHLDIKPDPDGGLYGLFLSTDIGASGANESIYYGNSSNYINWTIQHDPLMSKSTSGWDSTELYKPTSMKIKDDMKIWYSAKGGTTWGFGYADADLNATGVKYILERNNYPEFARRWISNSSTTYLNSTNKNLFISQGASTSAGDGGNRTIDYVFVHKYPQPLALTVSTEESVSNPTYIPPIPANLTNTTSNFYINHTWNAGAGNVTDSYNVSVNSTWHNSSIPYYNNSGLAAHGWSNISVYAFNSSSTGTLNQTPISMNTQISNNVPVQTNIGNKTVNENSWLNFSISSSDADNDSLTYATNATKGTLTGYNFSWKSNLADSGTYQWSFNTTDNYSAVATETITVTVNNIDFIPPIPVINSTITGNFYINTTWTAGAGNVTNGYNSTNGTSWINNTLTYRNTTLSAHAWQNLTIYAFNNSYGNLSATALTNNSQIPNNAPAQAGIGNKNANEGMWLNFTVSATDADSDTITYGTNASKGSFNPNAGNFNWSISYTDSGVYTWYFNSSDGYGGTGNETITVTIANIPLSLSNFNPASDPTTTAGNSQVFSLDINRSATVTWYINGTSIQTNTSVTSATYTNSSGDVGNWNVTSSVTDSIDSASHMWNWTVNAQSQGANNKIKTKRIIIID